MAGEVFDDEREGDPVGESVIIDSLEDIAPTVESNGGLSGDVCVEGVVVSGEEEAPDDCVALLAWY